MIFAFAYFVHVLSLIRPWLKSAGYDSLLVNKAGYGSDVLALAIPPCCDEEYETSCMSMVAGLLAANSLPQVRSESARASGSPMCVKA